MKNIFISGIDGNMGSRYATICRTLGLKVYGVDRISFTEQARFCKSNDIDGIIVATPTFTHIDAINIFGSHCEYVPMLVEKPLRKGRIKTMPNFKVTMVNQYKYLVDKIDSVGLSYYNYFKSGGDTMLWDCINIIGLANSEISIKANSPFWRCMINGQMLNIKDMDGAYLNMVRDWTKNPEGNREYIELAHDKVCALKESKPIPRGNKVKTGSQVIPILGKAID
tara:strand:+ start:3995 stop:4666 length:672 start_codon:yes stop_codon:yes gene_type:complete